MTRLQSELHRLYSMSPHGVRALVLEVAQPADWDALQQVWTGVQSELELPAPAIAVSGDDALQLWFSLARPAEADVAQAFLAALQARWLSALKPHSVRTPSAAATPVPPRQVAAEQWSAFVSPDLAAVFSETPWLDVEPGEEGQANLLRGLASITPAALEIALHRLAAHAAPPQAPVPAPAPPAPAGTTDPRRFLTDVMNDASAPLALRIEAAKALLPGADAAR